MPRGTIGAIKCTGCKALNKKLIKDHVIYSCELGHDIAAYPCYAPDGEYVYAITSGRLPADHYLSRVGERCRHKCKTRKQVTTIKQHIAQITRRQRLIGNIPQLIAK